jgi:hypothetical protein
MSSLQDDLVDLFFDFTLPDETFITKLGCPATEALLRIRRVVRMWIETGSARGRRLVLARLVGENIGRVLGNPGKVQINHILRAVELMDRQDAIAMRMAKQQIGDLKNITPSLIDQKIEALKEVLSVEEADEPSGGDQEAHPAQGDQG